jgi:hypothetical protein
MFKGLDPLLLFRTDVKNSGLDRRTAAKRIESVLAKIISETQHLLAG